MNAVKQLISSYLHRKTFDIVKKPMDVSVNYALTFPSL